MSYNLIHFPWPTKSFYFTQTNHSPEARFRIQLIPNLNSTIHRPIDFFLDQIFAKHYFTRVQ